MPSTFQRENNIEAESDRSPGGLCGTGGGGGGRDVHPLSLEGCGRAGDGGPRSAARHARTRRAATRSSAARGRELRHGGAPAGEEKRWSAGEMEKLGRGSSGERGPSLLPQPRASAPCPDQGSTPPAPSGWPRRPEGDRGARLRDHVLARLPARDPRKGTARSFGAPHSEWHEGPAENAGERGRPGAASPAPRPAP